MNDESMTSTTLPFRSRMPYQGLLLGAICLIMTLALLIAYRVTRGGIEQAALRDKLANLQQVLPPSLYDNNPVDDVTIVDDKKLSAQPVKVYQARKNGKLVAVAYEVVRPGYGGPITLLMGVDTAGNILGVRVLSQKETPGLGDRIDISKDNWITRFNKHSLFNTSEEQWHVKKDGGGFDQFTGATITPRAVVGAVHDGLLFHQRNFLKSSPDSGQSGDDAATGEEKTP